MTSLEDAVIVSPDVEMELSEIVFHSVDIEATVVVKVAVARVTFAA